MNTRTPIRPFKPTYVSKPLLSSSIAKIRRHYRLQCPGKNDKMNLYLPKDALSTNLWSVFWLVRCMSSVGRIHIIMLNLTDAYKVILIGWEILWALKFDLRAMSWSWYTLVKIRLIGIRTSHFFFENWCSMNESTFKIHSGIILTETTPV